MFFTFLTIPKVNKTAAPVYVFILQVSKDDRSDIESSSDEEMNSNNRKTPSQTLKPKDGHTGNLNGETHDHCVQ